MGRKSSISRLPAEQRTFVERLLREGRLTLDEMIVAIRQRFPATGVHRSGLHRYQTQFNALTERMRGQQEVARLMVAELGENPDDKSGEMLVQTITALANDVALRAAGNEDIDAEEVRKLSRSVKDIIDARSKSLKERKAIQQEAREAALREQREKLEALGKSGAVDPTALAVIIKAAYDL